MRFILLFEILKGMNRGFTNRAFAFRHLLHASIARYCMIAGVKLHILFIFVTHDTLMFFIICQVNHRWFATNTCQDQCASRR